VTFAEKKQAMPPKKSSSNGQSPRAWYTLGVLFILYAVSLLDRQIITLLISDIKHDLDLGEFQVSLLMGTAFGLFYVLGGFPLGWLADRIPPKFVIFMGMMVWSVSCAAGGLAPTFLGLFISRMMVGAGEASLSPSAYLLISRLFARERIGTPMAIYHLGASVGGAISFAAGGQIAMMATRAGVITLPLVGLTAPWQIVLLCAGLPGLLLAWLAFTLPDMRPISPSAAGIRGSGDVKAFSGFVRKNWWLLFCQFLAFAFSLIAVYSILFWSPEYLARAFGWDKAKIGLDLGVIGLAGAIAGQIFASVSLGRLHRAGVRDATLKLCLGIVIVAIPFIAAGFMIKVAWVCLVGIFMFNLTLMPLLTYGSSAIQLYTPGEFRGRVSGAFLAITSLSGLGAGPAIVGYLVQYQFRNEAQLGLALALVGVSCLGLVIVLLLAALRPFKRALLYMEAENARMGTTGCKLSDEAL
jgi:MFS family permease